ncbi:MAG: phosphatase PAP2 family protein [Coriobacteriia bacterium]|jgi:membrane-associated phospholipid phosphatase|nr:phosphatase PAP2 family protein [Coriobacteriia bacterium]
MTVRRMRRRRLDLVLMTIGAAVLVTSTLLAKRRVYDWEVAVFQAINGLPGSIRPYLWVLNQYGTAVTIPVAAAVALLFRRWLLALSLAISGVAVYVLARVIKEYVSRGRPSAFVEGVVERETFSSDSLGYPSGHAAVAWAITIIVLAYVGRPWQIAAIALAIVVPIVRMYVAAHLPLDLIGGAALGITVASAVNLLIGVPARTPTENTRAGPNTDEGGDLSDHQL